MRLSVTTTLHRYLKLAQTDAILRNSLFLMASMIVMAMFGLVFWLLSARLYSPTAVGNASTLIAVTTTLSMSSLFGYDNSLVRFLPTSHNRAELMDTALTVTGIGSAIVAGLFLLVSHSFLPSIDATLHFPATTVIFILTLIAVTSNTLTDSIFLSKQATEHTLIADTALSIAKLGLPIVLVGFGAIGVYGGYAVGVAVAASYSLVILAIKYNYRFRPRIKLQIVRQLLRYSGGTYLANISNAMPSLILPLMVATVLGAGQAAFFNLAMTISALLFMIPRATATSLFAEGSKNDVASRQNIMDTYRHTALILVPGIIAVIALHTFVLQIFGSAYAASGGVLVILALSAVFVAANSILTSQLLISQNVGRLIAAETLRTIVILAVGLPLMHQFGVKGAALAWLVGQAAMTIAIPLLKRPTTIALARTQSA